MTVQADEEDGIIDPLVGGRTVDMERQLGAEFRAVASARLGNEDVLLLVAFCGTCDKQVWRKFDTEGNLLIVGPWRHRYPVSDHEVSSIRTRAYGNTAC